MAERQQIEHERRIVAPSALRMEDGDGAPVIHLLAAVFNSRSVDLGFFELIEEGFFSDVIDGDTVGNWQHDDSVPLARTTATPATLTLEETSAGLATVWHPDDTQWNRDRVFSPLRRGEVQGGSFQFTVKRGEPGNREQWETWEELADGSMLRTLHPGGCKELLDVTLATRPAYPATLVAMRSLGSWRDSRTGGTEVGELQRRALLARARISQRITP